MQRSNDLLRSLLQKALTVTGLSLFAGPLLSTISCPVYSQDTQLDIDPIAYSKSAAARGKSYYLINCQQCHDADGKALANIDYIAADLTAPERWLYGTSALNIFFSIKNGAGLEMPPFKDALNDEEIWHIVAHVLNIGPAETRPAND